MTATRRAERLDRRAPARGDERKAALLEALDSLLADGATLDTINVAEVSSKAGVTRSAFYFYFESKAYAAAALATDMYDEVMADTAKALAPGQDLEPRERFKAMLTDLFDVLEKHQHTYRAMLEARATTPTVAQLWDVDRASFVVPIQEWIESERAAGRAPDGPDAYALAADLLELNDRAMERHASGSGLPRDVQIDTLTTIWLRSIYASL